MVANQFGLEVDLQTPIRLPIKKKMHVTGCACRISSLFSRTEKLPDVEIIQGAIWVHAIVLQQSAVAIYAALHIHIYRATRHSFHFS